MRSKHWMPKDQFIVVVTRRSVNKFFYGCTRKEAIQAAGLKDGEVFTARRYLGGKKTVCELSKRGKVVKEYR